MRPSSPVIAEYKPPFKGMDTRSVTAPDAPDLLLNVDVSDRGVYRARPGVRPEGLFIFAMALVLCGKWRF
jgi:hypothetical protein